VKQQRPEPNTIVRQPPRQSSTDQLPDFYPVPERDRYASRALSYLILLNGFAALILVSALAFAPQSASDPRRLSWAMLVFGCGALAGLLSSLFAYISRTAMASGQLVVQDLLRVGAIIAAVGSGAAFLTALNMMALTVPESSSTRPKSKPQEQAPHPTPAHAVPQTPFAPPLKATVVPAGRQLSAERLSPYSLGVEERRVTLSTA
jgi:hypothetical protein